MGKSIVVIAALLALLFSAPAFGADASVRAIDFASSGRFVDNSGSDQTDNTVNVVPGGTVEFFSLGTNVAHNVKFDTLAPASCVQTEGPVIGAVPPMPAFAVSMPWKGTCTFATAGTYTFVCSVHPDMTGKVEVGALNTAPTVTAERTPAGNVITGTTLTFTAAASDADNDALTYTWEFGDGQTGTGASATHLFATAGSYTAKVTVSDGRGGSASATVPVVVENPPPVLVADPPPPPPTTLPAQNAPTGTLGGKAKQKLGASFALTLSGTSDAVTVNATGSATVKKKAYKLTPLRNLKVAKGAQAKLTLKVPAALRKQKSVKVKVTVTLTAANGKSATLTKTVTLTK